MNQVLDNLYLDDGWTNINGAYIKGYSTECNIYEHVTNIIDGYQPIGKWCLIYEGKIYHPKLRGFPLYKFNDEITNIKFDDFQLVDYEIELPSVEGPLISLDDAAYQIGNILLENTENFLRFNDIGKLTVIFTGGLDSTTSWAVLDSITKNYIFDVYIVGPNKIAYSDYESDLITHMRKQSWSYKIVRYYKEINWLLTGFYSERFQMREVTNGDMICSFLKKDIFDLVHQNDYLYWFLKRPHIKSVYNLQTEKELKDCCFNSIQHDYQGWHLNNNFQFSPFFDRRITEIAYRLSLDDMILNLRNGVLQRKIIERFNPKFLSLVSDYKNSQKVYANFLKNWENVELSSTIPITISRPIVTENS